MSNRIQVEDKYFDFVCQLLERLAIKFEVIHLREEEIRNKEVSARVEKSFKRLNISPVPKLESNQSKKKK